MDQITSGQPKPQRCAQVGARPRCLSFLRWATGICGCASLVGLAGCVSYAPDPLDPAEELRQLLLRPSERIERTVEGPWRKEWFPLQADVVLADGMSLGEANALALFYSPAVLAARAEARVAGAQVLQAGVLSNPELFLGPRVSTKDSGLIFPAGISWNLPLWGTGSAEREAADARFLELRLRALDVEMETLTKVREFYAHLARLQREEEVLATVATSSERIVAWVEALQRTGGVDAVSLFLAKAEQDDATTELMQLRAAAKTARRELFLLLGVLPNAAVLPVLDPSGLAMPELLNATAETLRRNPSLKAAEAAYAAADATLRREISLQYPKIRFGPEFESDRGESSVGLGLGISLPLFDHNKGGIAAAEASRSASRDRYRAALLAASHAEARAREELETVSRLLEIHTQGALRVADQAGSAVAIRLETGQAQVVEVLSAQRAIARVRTRALELEERAAIARVRAAVAGGLAWEPPATVTSEEIKK